MTRAEYLRRKALKSAVKAMPPMKPIPSLDPIYSPQATVMTDESMLLGMAMIASRVAARRRRTR